MHSALGYTKVQGDIAMNSRERVKRALTFERPDRVPRDLWHLAGVSRSRKPELSRLLETYPSDFTGPQGTYGPSPLASGSEGDVGEYTDAWGCTFVMAEPGVCGEVKNPPLADWSELDNWAPPWMVLEHMDLGQVDAACAATDKFVRTGTHVRPFERMQFLRGSENLFMDIAMRPPEFEDLRRQIHDFNLRDIEAWCGTAVDGIAFMDDWGTQNALLIAPAQWREIFKPMYREYCELIKSAGKLVFFHSDGTSATQFPISSRSGSMRSIHSCSAWTLKPSERTIKARWPSGEKSTVKRSCHLEQSKKFGEPSNGYAARWTIPAAASSPSVNGATAILTTTSRLYLKRGWNKAATDRQAKELASLRCAQTSHRPRRRRHIRGEISDCVISTRRQLYARPAHKKALRAHGIFEGFCVEPGSR